MDSRDGRRSQFARASIATSSRVAPRRPQVAVRAATRDRAPLRRARRFHVASIGKTSPRPRDAGSSKPAPRTDAPVSACSPATSSRGSSSDRQRMSRAGRPRAPPRNRGGRYFEGAVSAARCMDLVVASPPVAPRCSPSAATAARSRDASSTRHRSRILEEAPASATSASHAAHARQRCSSTRP